jgi:hypothetical protein
LSCTSEDKRGGEGIGRHRPPQWPSERFPVVIPDLLAIDENVVVRLAVDVSEIRAADRQRRREAYEKSKRKQGQGDGGGDGKGKWKQARGGEEVEAIKRMEEIERLTARYLNDTRVEMVAAKTVVKQLVSHTGQTQSDLVRLLDDMMRHPAGSDGWARRAWYGIFWYVPARCCLFPFRAVSGAVCAPASAIFLVDDSRNRPIRERLLTLLNRRSGGPRARVKRQVEKALSILDAALAASDEFIGQGDGHENRFANLAGLCRVSHQKELSMKRDAQATVARQKRGEVADRQRALSRVREGSPKAKLMENRLIQLREQVQAHEKAVAKGEGLQAAKGKALCDVSEEVSAEFRDLLARVKKDQDCRKKVSRVLLRLGEDVKSWAAAMPAEDMRRTEEELRDGVEAYLGLLGTLWRGNRKEVDRLCRW